ncbi:hypothetical protein BDP27DRAFT_1362901 [Rhodocollybia butyracea]|uniref:Uncharacterized protein n=1 Tax=Rhodocollybia butyracea TaxID=206335 RepID=A0A9P5PVA7_9AGAR|nr:hypothetical protein BDP27DRAFT_1362901 [Rhodocollybia butyracea]
MGEKVGAPPLKMRYGDFELNQDTVQYLHDQLPRSIVYYYQLIGGKFCSPPRKCFGDIVNPLPQYGQLHNALGSLVVVEDEKIVDEIEISTQAHYYFAHRQEYVKFLTEFELVRGAVKKMHGQPGISAAIQEAGDILHKQDKGSIAGATGAVEKLSVTLKAQVTLKA